MAMRHRQKRFVPTTVKQRAEALGETDMVSIDYLLNQTKNIYIFRITSAE